MGKFQFSKSNTEGKSLNEKAQILDNKSDFDIRFIEYEKIIPNPYNEKIYEMSGIEELAQSIKEFGLMQNLEVNEIEENGEKVYRLIGGHRRFKAIQLLRENDEVIFNTIPCKVERDLEELEEKIRLLKSNSDTRELTSKEKRLQNQELVELLKEYAARSGKKINIKKEVAKETNQDIKTVERYNNINERLIPQLQQYFDENKISFTEAYNFAVLDEQMQLAILDILQSKDKISKDELNVIRTQNKKLVEEAEEKNKELEQAKKEIEERESQISILESEKSELEQEVENNKVEKEVVEEEKAKLEKKIREEISLLTEEELNKTKEALEEANKKALELEAKEKNLTEQLKNKELEHKKMLEEVETSEDDIEKDKINIEITKESIEKEVAKARVEDIKSTITKQIIELGNLIKKNNLTDDSEILVNEIEKALQVLKNKVTKII